MIGRVKSFSMRNRYGFIDVKGEDYFFHMEEWMGKEYPKPGDMVDFQPFDSSKGKKALIVSKIRR